MSSRTNVCNVLVPLGTIIDSFGHRPRTADALPLGTILSNL